MIVISIGKSGFFPITNFYIVISLIIKMDNGLKEGINRGLNSSHFKSSPSLHMDNKHLKD